MSVSERSCGCAAVRGAAAVLCGSRDAVDDVAAACSKLGVIRALHEPAVQLPPWNARPILLSACHIVMILHSTQRVQILNAIQL